LIDVNIKDLKKIVTLGGKDPPSPKTTEGRRKNLLNSVATRMGLSPRAYHRIIKLARTIADLAGSEQTQDKHLAEALGYREKKN
jgi:predicted ATPase with chaperone activity